MNLVPISAHEEREVRLASRMSSRATGAEFSQVLAAAVSKTAVSATHTVQQGESLWKICASQLEQAVSKPSHQQVHQVVMQVAKENGLSDPDMLQVGQVLSLSALAGSAAGSVSASPVPPLIPRAVAASSRGTGGPGTTQATKRLVFSTASLAHATSSQKRSPSAEGLSTPRRAAFRNHTPARTTSARSLVASACTSKEVSEPNTRGDLVDRIRAILLGNGGAKRGERSSTAWPTVLDGPAEVSSAFGMRKDPFTHRRQFHEGVDLAVDSGTRIYPVKAGKVVFSGRQAGYGNVVVVRHDDHTETVYGHNKTNLARAGQHVTSDTPVGLSGSTGRSTGPHLHFEVRVNGRAVDPMPFLEQRSFQVAKAS